MDLELKRVINNMAMQLLNLEIQLAQLSNDAAARGSMVAVEYLRQEVELLREMVKER